MSVIETELPTALRSNSWTVWHRNIVEAVPRLARRKDATLPVIIAVSILAHVAAIVAMFVSQTKDAQPKQQEISVELVAPPKLAPPPVIKAPPPPPPPAAKAPDKKAPANAEPKAQSKPEAKAESKAQPKTEPKAEAKAQPKAAPKAAPKPTLKEAPKAASKPADTAKPPAPGDVARRMKALLGPTPQGLGNPDDQDDGGKDLASLSAEALSGESADGTDTISFKRIVMSHIAKAKSEGACAPVADGATVEFVLAPTGTLSSVALLRPSGNAALDTEAVALVKRGEPYPPPPPGSRSDYVFTLRCGTR